jgi:branched-chain amino acid transport system substrate-binding protein
VRLNRANPDNRGRLGTKETAMTARLILPRRTILAGAAASLTAPYIVRAADKEPLKIGSSLPLTGSQAGYGNDFATGWRMAVKDVNDAGGVTGRQLELITLDTQAEPALGINAANRFIGVEKLPIFFTAWSAVVKAQAPIANREKVLEINDGANSPEIATLGDYVYTAFPLADVDITKLAKYVYTTLGKKTAAVLYINNDTGIDAAKLYRDTFTAAGGKIVAFEAYDPKATEFTGMLLKTRAANPEIVHLHGLTADTPQVIAQMRQLGMTQRVTSYSAAYNPKLVQQLGAAAEGIIVTSLAPGVNDNPNVGKFLERWKAEQGRVPNGLPYVQYQYDMVYLTKALYEYLDKKGQPATGDTLKDALLSIGTFELPMTGKMVIEGHRVNKPVYLLTVEKGAFVPLATL